MSLTAQAWSLLYQFWLHTEAIGRLGPLELVFNTPSHHRVHHGKNVAYLDRNHGGIFIIWDRLFGTFAPEAERVVYGLTKDIATYNPLRIAFHDLAAIGRDVARAPTLLAKLGYALRPPGWRPRRLDADCRATAAPRAIARLSAPRRHRRLRPSHRRDAAFVQPGRLSARSGARATFRRCSR